MERLRRERNAANFVSKSHQVYPKSTGKYIPVLENDRAEDEVDQGMVGVSD